MKALVFHAPNAMSLDELPDPSPGAGEVLVRMRACGICGSDVHGYMGMVGRRIPPLVMGHEFAGQIEKLGESVSGWREGDRVVPYPVLCCGACDMCLAGRTNLCRRRRILGILNVNGAMAEYVVLPAENLFKLKEAVSYENAALTEPLAVAYRAVDNAGDISGKSVLVVGAGAIGLMAVACAKMKKAGSVGISGFGQDRLSLAKKLGADAIIDPTREDFLEAVGKLGDGRGFDACIEAVGTGASIRQALSALTAGGTCVIAGIPSPADQVGLQEVVTKELKIAGSMVYTRREFGRCVSLVNEGALDPGPFISRVLPLRDGAAAFESLARDRRAAIKVVLTAGADGSSR